MKWNPVGNLLVLRPVTQADQTQGGVYIPDTARKLIDEGVVVELGPKVDQSLFPNGLKVGDRVAVRRYAGGWLKLAKGDDQLGADAEDLNRLIIEDEDVLVVPTDA